MSQNRIEPQTQFLVVDHGHQIIVTAAATRNGRRHLKFSHHIQRNCSNPSNLRDPLHIGVVKLQSKHISVSPPLNSGMPAIRTEHCADPLACWNLVRRLLRRHGALHNGCVAIPKLSRASRWSTREVGRDCCGAQGSSPPTQHRGCGRFRSKTSRENCGQHPQSAHKCQRRSFERPKCIVISSKRPELS